VQQFLPAKRMPFVPHPPYSPDFFSCDFFLCPRNKSNLRDRRFQDVLEIYGQPLSALHAFRKSQFQRCFQQQHKGWTRFVNSEGTALKGGHNGRQHR
jgi:hypothetical protein